MDPSRLARQITDAYVQLTVTTSLLQNETSPSKELLDDLQSIGAANEAIALAIKDPSLRRAAAYVAACAYAATSNASPQITAHSPLIDANSLSPQVAAVLLFLAADAPADAADIASTINVDESIPLKSLVDLVKRLGRGQVHLDDDRDVIIVDLDMSPSAIGATVGFSRCEEEMLRVCRVLDGDTNALADGGTFSAIAADMEFTLPLGGNPAGSEVLNRFTGPWHLARLMEIATPAILASATTRIATPAGLDESAWAQHRARISRRRPVLWRNHREAIDLGLLERGTSAVLAFPTGAGKSTMSELKVIASILDGRNVVCLAPTLSLVDQLARSFRQVAPSATIIAQYDPDDTLPEPPLPGPGIFVMTPESCLAALSFDHQQFGNVGLVMFDEAHLMHTEGQNVTRRSLDASLCFLTLARRFPSADLLLVSAMIANAPELASWLTSVTGRKAVALDSPWKPTRQAKGAVVYQSEDIERLRATLRSDFATTATDATPKATRDKMTAIPLGFFSLEATWESTSTEDYRLTELLTEPVQLGTRGSRRKDGEWWLTPNANVVAARLARAAARSQMKTLVFTHQPTWTASTAAAVNAGSSRRTPLSAVELTMLARINDALGSSSASYLEVENLAVVGDAVPHHGLLLPDERRLHERLFQRANGVPILVATSTVAQGMNFPSELVVIAGDQRYDAASNRNARIEAHELLNAAGRAGRAGAHSNALVLVIPGSVVEYDGQGRIGAGWGDLRDAFSQSDQCLQLGDSIGPLLEHSDSDDNTGLLDYLTRRLDSSTEVSIGPDILRSSFSAHRRRLLGQDDWIETKISSLSEALDAVTAEPWARHCSVMSGVALSDILLIAGQLDDLSEETHDLEAALSWVLDLLMTRPQLLETTLRAGSRAALSGTTDDLDSWADSGRIAVDHLRALVPLWLAGANLFEIQQAGISRGLAKESDKKLVFARKFVLRVIPDLAYVVSLPALVYNERATFSGAEPLQEGHGLMSLGRCVEFGVDSYEKANLMASRPGMNRRELRTA